MKHNACFSFFYAHAMPTLWNNLPADIRSSSTIQIFNQASFVFPIAADYNDYRLDFIARDLTWC